MNRQDYEHAFNLIRLTVRAKSPIIVSLEDGTSYDLTKTLETLPSWEKPCSTPCGSAYTEMLKDSSGEFLWLRVDSSKAKLAGRC